MLKTVCWGICLCVFVQSIEGKSIDFNSVFQDFNDKSRYLQTGVRENEQIEDDLSNGALKAICNYARIPLDVNPDSYLKCIQRFLEENGNIRLRKRSVEDDNTAPQVPEDNNNENTIHEKEETATSERLSDELIVPVEYSTAKSSENVALPVSEVKPQESVTANTSSDDIILPAIIAVENSPDNSSLPVNEITDNNNEHTIHEKEETATSERLSDELIVPGENSTAKSSENVALPVSEVKPQESVTANTSSDDIILPAIIAVENSPDNSSLPVNEITDHSVESPNIILEKKETTTTERLADESKAPAEVATENGSKITTLSASEVNPQEPSTNKTSSYEVIVASEIAAPKEVATENSLKTSTLAVSEDKPQEPATNKTSSDEVIVASEIAAPKEVATENSLKTSTLAVSEVKPQEPATNRSSSDEVSAHTEIAIEKSSENPSLPVNPITDESLSNNSLLTQESNILKIGDNTLKMLNSGETNDSTVSSLNSTTDTPVLFKNGFDDILKNTPGKQHNISIKEGEHPKGTLGSSQMQTVLLEVSKNDSAKTIEGGEISKAGESQEKSTSSPNNILLIVFAILGVVGTLAFAFNYIKKRREDREVNEMIKLEEEGRELKEIKPLMKSNFVQNGSKSLEYIDADPQLQVETETKDEKN